MTAKVDRRDQILSRLAELLPTLNITLSTGIIPPSHFVRNRDELPEELVPGIIMLDGDERRDQRFPSLQGRSERTAPSMVIMTPEIYVVLDVRKPHNKLVGEDLNAARTVILDAVFHDANLQAFTGSGGSTQLEATVTDLARNRQMRGQMGLVLSFSYPLIPGELQAA